MEENQNFEQAINVNVGDHLLINGFPCKIMDRSTSKTGKHGGCKINYVGIDIFTQKKYAIIYRSSDNVNVPIITKDDYQLINIDDSEEPAYLTLMSNKQTVRMDVQLPQNEIGEKIKQEFNNGKDVTIIVQKAMSQEAVLSYKINK